MTMTKIQNLIKRIGKLLSKQKFCFDDRIGYPIKFSGDYQGIPCTYIINAPDENGNSVVDIRLDEPVQVIKYTITLEDDCNV